MTSIKMWLTVLLMVASCLITIDARPSEEIREKRSVEDSGDQQVASPQQMQQPIVLVDPAELEYLAYLRNMILSRARTDPSTALYGLDSTSTNPLISKRAGNLCLPGTDCDSINWGDEADAKDLLAPGADTNPGRRRRRRSVMSDATAKEEEIDMVNKVKDEEEQQEFAEGLQAMLDLKQMTESRSSAQTLLNMNPDMVDTFLTKCLDDANCRDELLASRLESIKTSSDNKFFKRIE